jgi:uracil-DNA glycosylase
VDGPDDRIFFSELRLIDPEVVVVLGATAGRALLGLSSRVTKDRPANPICQV